MKKWLIFTICVCLLSGCTRYTPTDMTEDTQEGVLSGDTADESLPAEAGRENNETDSESKTGNTATGQDAPTQKPEKQTEENIIRINEENSHTTKRKPVKVKGIYISAYVAGNETMIDNIIKQIDETQLNAVVIDFKNDDGRITAPIDSEKFRETGACKAYIPDMKALIQKLKEHDIYTIARIVAFRDPWLAEKKPEWSLKKSDGSLYRDKQGLAWINPYKEEVWDYLVEAGIRAAEAGFDEVQFDYIRFATDSTIRQVVYDEKDIKGRSKTDVITEFTQYAYDRLVPHRVFVSADVFGAIIGSVEDAEAVGQIYVDMAKNLDYICPMIYPSHYGDGNFGLDHPDKYPYKTIMGALQKSREELSSCPEGERLATVRPWLQDFTATYLKHHIKYGDEEIREQIRAVHDAGYEEWILWNASNKYHYGGLKP